MLKTEPPTTFWKWRFYNVLVLFLNGLKYTKSSALLTSTCRYHTFSPKRFVHVWKILLEYSTTHVTSGKVRSRNGTRRFPILKISLQTSYAMLPRHKLWTASDLPLMLKQNFNIISVNIKIGCWCNIDLIVLS